MSKRVALVLSSGGARGLAHIGVIESLEERGYEITSIAGSSIGAIIGACYASGNLKAYKEWALKMDQWNVFNLIDFTLSSQGFIKGEKVFKEMEKIIPDMKIQDMKIPFVAVATDIQKGKEVVFKKGSMYRAIKASASIPTVIRPSQHKGRELIDGGVMTPIPVEFIKKKKKDLLVISDVNGAVPFHPPQNVVRKPELDQNAYQKQLATFAKAWERFLPASDTKPTRKLGYFDLLTRTIHLMQDKLAQLLIDEYDPDLYIKVSRDACGVFDFHKTEEMIAVGKESFDEAFEQSEMKAAFMESIGATSS